MWPLDGLKLFRSINDIFEKLEVDREVHRQLVESSENRLFMVTPYLAHYIRFKNVDSASDWVNGEARRVEKCITVWCLVRVIDCRCLLIITIYNCGGKTPTWTSPRTLRARSTWFQAEIWRVLNFFDCLRNRIRVIDQIFNRSFGVESSSCAMCTKEHEKWHNEFGLLCFFSLLGRVDG